MYFFRRSRIMTESVEIDNNSISTFGNGIKRVFGLVTVEPIAFLFSFAFSLTSVVEQDFYFHKTCKVDLSYPSGICENLTLFKDEQTIVQVAVSSFNQWNELATWILPICLSLFIGGWSDKRGRKLLVLLGLFGKIWWSAWVVVIASKDNWPVTTVTWLSSFLSGITGADVAIAAGCCSYLSDVTSGQDRTLRFTILEICSVVAGPVGVAFGNYLFYYVCNKSYAAMFAINTAFLITAFVYAFIRLNWTTSSLQTSMPPCCGGGQPSCLSDFFDKTSFLDSIKTFAKRRRHSGRSILVLLMISLGLFMFIRDEKHTYLYTVKVFGWNVDAFSHFRTFQLSVTVIGTLVALPMMTLWLKLSDTTIIMFGTMSNAISRAMFALWNTPRIFYFGSLVSCVGPVAAPAIRSLVSKITPVDERGKVLAVLSVADTCMPIVTSIVYTQVYNSTITSYPTGIFWVATISQLMVFVFAIVMRMIGQRSYGQV